MTKQAFLKNYAYTKTALYNKIEVAVLRERQSAIAASAYTSDDGDVRVIVSFPRGENSQRHAVYRVDGNKAREENGVWDDVITLWEA